MNRCPRGARLSGMRMYQQRRTAEKGPLGRNSFPMNVLRSVEGRHHLQVGSSFGRQPFARAVAYPSDAPARPSIGLPYASTQGSELSKLLPPFRECPKHIRLFPDIRGGRN